MEAPCPLGRTAPGLAQIQIQIQMSRLASSSLGCRVMSLPLFLRYVAAVRGTCPMRGGGLGAVLMALPRQSTLEAAAHTDLQPHGVLLRRRGRAQGGGALRGHLARPARHTAGARHCAAPALCAADDHSHKAVVRCGPRRLARPPIDPIHFGARQAQGCDCDGQHFQPAEQDAEEPHQGAAARHEARHLGGG